MQRNEERSDAGFLIILVVLAVVPGILYQFFAPYINAFLLQLAAYELRIFTLFSNEAAEAIQKIRSADPGAMTWTQVSQVTSYVGKFLRWPFAVLMLLMTVIAFSSSRIWKLRRRLSMRSLIKNNAEIFPCLQPIIGRGDYLLSPDSYDKGFWQVARSPIQLAITGQLLRDYGSGDLIQAKDVLTKGGMADVESAVLGRCEYDAAKAKDFFLHQLGEKFNGVDQLTPVRQAILGAFLAHGAGDKLKAISSLYGIAETYKEQGSTPSVDITVENLALLKQHSGLLESEKLLSRHQAYQLPLLMAALNFARKKGVLAGSQFLWLRPVDRPLWYALNQMGGKTAWVEGLAPWSHFYCEETFKKPLDVPFVDGAVEGLREYLDREGWLREEDPVPQEQPVDMAILPLIEVPEQYKSGFTVVSETTGIEHKIYSSYD